MRFKTIKHFRLKALMLLLLVVVFVAGAGVALYWERQQSNDLQDRFNLLGRRVLIENPSDILLDFRPLQNEYADYLQQNKLEDKVSLYFEYLPSGSSIGINEDKELLGASLLKLPLSMSAMKLAEAGKLDLDQRVPLKKEWLNNLYGDLYKKGEGYKISYREAIEQALVNSDNTAALLLFDIVSEKQGTKAPNILGFVDANYATGAHEEVLIGPQSYSSILKCLYFSCHLSHKDSQEILTYLTRSTATDRLTRYLPNELKVAHKIGTFKGVNQSDCGIFYIPKRNYILCVMVEEPDPQASSVIADLSQITYEFIRPKDENNE